MNTLKTSGRLTQRPVIGVVVLALYLSPDFARTRSASAMYSATYVMFDLNDPNGSKLSVRTEGSARPMGIRQKSDNESVHLGCHALENKQLTGDGI